MDEHFPTFSAGRSRFVAGWKNNKSGAKRGAGAESRPGPRTKVNAMYKEDINHNMMIEKFNCSLFDQSIRSEKKQ